MNKNKEIGQEGENKAVEFLKKKKYEILEVNWFHNHKEIDIIARQHVAGQKYPFIVFVEVKSRTYKYLNAELPHQSVTRLKQRHIIAAANAYIMKKNIMNEARYDIISVINYPDKTVINHIESAFYPIVR